MTSRRLALAGAVVALLAPAGGARAAHAATTTIRDRGGEFFFRLSKRSIPRPGRVTFRFENTGGMPHDFQINGKRTPPTQPGSTSKLAVRFKRKGSYRYFCTVPGHAAAGMRGVFRVR
jgi:plastocyanin